MHDQARTEGRHEPVAINRTAVSTAAHITSTSVTVVEGPTSTEYENPGT